MRARPNSQPLAGPAGGTIIFFAVTAVRSWTQGLASMSGAEWAGLALISIAVAILVAMFVEKDRRLTATYTTP